MLYFETDETREIAIGETYVDVPCTCQTDGEEGNGLIAGQISTLVDPIAYVDSAVNTEVSAGGADIESDEDFTDRIYLAPSGYSVAGPRDAYKYHTKSFMDAAIGDVEVTSPEPCEVEVRFLLSDGSLPSETLCKKVLGHLNDDNIRPLTDRLSVLAPTGQGFNIRFTYYINKSDMDKAVSIQSAVAAALQEYISWQTHTIGRDINPSVLTKMMVAAGAKRVVMQSLPLSIKIRMTQYRIREWVDYYGADGVYIAFSGGKDSSVLLHIAREMYPEISAVYVDTGLEYPEVREFVKRQENVEIIRPKMNFRQVIIKYGYPMIGKEVAGCVYGARRYMEKLLEREKSAEHGGKVPNHSYMADLVGIDRREDKENELYKSLIRGEIPSKDIKTPVRYLIMQGKYPHKENGVETSEYSKMYNKERYKFFLEAPFEIADHCCSIMKKSPIRTSAKSRLT